jgi:putative flavoprotein involved in K+ transport
MKKKAEFVQTVVIGGGQSGLAVGYHLAQQGLPFVILDASSRVGDVWRKRWDSLRLFTPAYLCSLPGMAFPAAKHAFPTKDQMADYLEAYADRFSLPVKSGVRVDRLSRRGDRYLLACGDRHIEAEHVVVAMSRYQEPVVPEFANKLDPAIVQLHSRDYLRPEQLQEGVVLIAGVGNSGADIALDVSRSHRTLLAGRATGHLPFRIETLLARYVLQPLILRFVFHHVLTVDTPMGRKARRGILSKGGPLIRVKPKDLEDAGVERLPRVTGVQDGLPVLEDGRVLEVENVIWCTGFDKGSSWIDLPVFGEYGIPKQYRGVVDGEPGLYFIGLPFIYSFSSAMIQGVGRDAGHVVKTIENRVCATRPRGSQHFELDAVETTATAAK